MRSHAIVLGASLSGLVTARVLTAEFDRVTIIDRDQLPAGPEARRGVPQGRHAHGILAAGREALEELFPGLTDRLVAQGAVTGDLQGDVRWYVGGHLLRQKPSGMQGILLSRPLLEHHVRASVLESPNVDLVAPAEVLDLILADGRVTGVHLRQRAPDATDQRLEADLVVDATGRGSHMPVWLESLGYPRPAESVIDIGLTYTSWDFPHRPGDLDGDSAAIMGPTIDTPRFGAALLQENDRWIVTSGSYHGERAPIDLAEFQTFTASLSGPEIAELVCDREPLGPPRQYRFPSSVRRHYERLSRFPRGLLVIGDALCSFNPAYGQGMSVAALEALELRACLAGGGSPADLARGFFQRVARVIDIPWDMAAGGDLRLPIVPGPRPARLRLLNAYVAQVQAAGARDPRIAREFLRVANLVQRPEALLHPVMVSRVIGARIRSMTSARDSAPATAGRSRAQGVSAVIPPPRTGRGTDSHRQPSAKR
jgi:2-polyprenyl-6-methoxyphenol hydroxylase-like FAD-dependent oxidoreductase